MPDKSDAGVGASVAPIDESPKRLRFAGSESCRDCHPAQYDEWKRDWHHQALSVPNAKTVKGRFDGAHFKGRSTEATMLTRGSEYLMRTNDRGGVAHEYPVQWLVGGKRMQDALTEIEDGRWQVLPVYFHVTGRGEWVDYNEAKQGAVGPTHPFFWQNFRRTANRECLGCHATGVSVSYDRTSHRWLTSMVEPGVGCEACHGPGDRHVETKLKRDIVSVKALTGPAQNAVCAACDGSREPIYGALDATHRFLPGAKYEAFFEPSGLVDGETRSGEYFVDGRPSSSSFEWQAMQQSRCFLEGGVTCLSCHTAPHAAQGANEIKPGAQLCSGCHEALTKEVKAHSHHTSATGQSCVGCHMPKVVSGVLDHFADHALDVPVPENTVAHGVPNACALCHEKKSAEALAEKVAAWWPDSKRRMRRRVLADAFDEKTKSKSEAALVTVVTDGSEAPLLRAFAAELLGQRFPARAAKELPAVLEADDGYLRSRVLAGLSAARARASTEQVAMHLEDPSVVVRQLSAALLSSWGDARGVAALVRLAREPQTKTLARPHLILAQRAVSAKHFEAARREVAAVLALMPYSVSALVLEADLAVRRRDVPAAKAALEEALRFDSANVDALRRLELINSVIERK